jgi:carbonic anhydrase
MIERGGHNIPLPTEPRPASLNRMSVIDGLIAANAEYVKTFPGPRPLEPALHLAIVACMDSRLALFGALGLQIGDAHLIRNAGGIVTDDMLRSLAISQRKIGTREIAIIQHSNCGMSDFDDQGFRNELLGETGQIPKWNVPGFVDVEQSVRASVERTRNCRWLPHRESVRGFVFDVVTAEITEIH